MTTSRNKTVPGIGALIANWPKGVARPARQRGNTRLRCWPRLPKATAVRAGCSCRTRSRSAGGGSCFGPLGSKPRPVSVKSQTSSWPKSSAKRPMCSAWSALAIGSASGATSAVRSCSTLPRRAAGRPSRPSWPRSPGTPPARTRGLPLTWPARPPRRAARGPPEGPRRAPGGLLLCAAKC